MMFIQILVDNKFRDLINILILSDHLKNNLNGVKVILSNKRNFDYIYNQLKPEMIILPHAFGFMNKKINNYKDESLIVILPSVGANTSKEYLNYRYISNTSDDNIKSLSKIFLWGDESRHILEESGKFANNVLMTTGVPKFDKLKSDNNFSNISPKVIGFCSSARHLASLKGLNILQLINIYSKLDATDENNYYPWNEGGQYADSVWNEAAFYEILQASIKRINFSFPDSIIKIRPHPFESTVVYNDWFKQTAINANISNKLHVWEFISQLKVLIQLFSTIAVEAFLIGVPVISLKNLIGERIYDHSNPVNLNNTLDDHYWNPKNLDELINLIQLSESNQLDLCPDVNILQKKLNSRFNINSDSSACQLITSNISELLVGKKENKRGVNFKFVSNSFFYELFLCLTKYKHNDYNYSLLRINDYLMANKIRSTFIL